MRSTFFSAVLTALNLVALALAATPLPSLSQDVAAAVGWWPEGSNPTVVAEQIGGSTLEMIVRRAGKMETCLSIFQKFSCV
jgi:hypothetical protein